MELKTEDFDYAHLQDNHFHTKSPPSPSPVLEAEPPVELDNDKVILRTPTSALSKIQSVFTCPPAPRKPKAAPSGKRKGRSHTEMRLLDLSNDVLSMYPPALLKDFGNKLKKARRDHQHEQLKENICSNINYTTN